MKRQLLAGGALALVALGAALGTDEERPDRFRQLHELLPTPNAQRTASGAPGHAYWQQQVDYRIEVTLDEAERRLTGLEHVAYHNNSPDDADVPLVSARPEHALRPTAARLVLIEPGAVGWTGRATGGRTSASAGTGGC